MTGSTVWCGVAAASVALLVSPGAASGADEPVPEPPNFTSILTSTATPDKVVDDAGRPAPGQPGALGFFTLRVNSQLDVVCYEIVLQGVTPPFESPARTATHLQEGPPMRVATLGWCSPTRSRPAAA